MKNRYISRPVVAGVTGLEPAAFGVTGRVPHHINNKKSNKYIHLTLRICSKLFEIIRFISFSASRNSHTQLCAHKKTPLPSIKSKMGVQL